MLLITTIMMMMVMICLLCRKSKLVKSDSAFRQRLMYLIKNLKR